MPFDATPTKTRELTLDNLIAWLETKDADEGYRWQDPRSCLFAQFQDAEADARLEEWQARIAVNPPHTFGAALERARKLHDATSNGE
jgi:hypothetical protein